MLERILTLQNVLTYVVPAGVAILFILLALFIPRIRKLLAKDWPSPTLREVQWGFVGILLGVVFFVFGICLTMVTFYLSQPIPRNPVMLGLAIGLTVLGLAAFAYVIGLGMHFRKVNQSSEDAILVVTVAKIAYVNPAFETIRDKLRVIRTQNHEITVRTLQPNTAKVGVSYGQRKRHREEVSLADYENVGVVSVSGVVW